MDYFIAQCYSPSNLKLLNQCRLYLQAFSLTDITSADGKQIIQHYKKGILGQDRRSNLRWPTQQRPGKKAWNLWQQALQHLEERGNLIKPLGKWTTPPHQIWHWFMDPISLVLYKEENNKWFRCKPLTRPCNKQTCSQSKPLYQLSTISPSIKPSLDIFPATITNDPITALATATSSSSQLQVQDTKKSPHPSFYELLTTPPFYARILGPISTSLEELADSISDYIIQDNLYLCTDGSYDPHISRGAHGWVIANDSETLWQGAGPSDGHPKLMSPYRAEFSGSVAGLHILKCLTNAKSLMMGTVIFFCDCEKAIKVLNNKSYKGIVDYLGPDSYLVQEAKNLLQSIPIPISLQWVKGHYTGNTPTLAQN
jgi:hypothetical protein